jgi:hypothetical protein
VMEVCTLRYGVNGTLDDMKPNAPAYTLDVSWTKS